MARTADRRHLTLKVKCGTWKQVETFYRRKVRAGNRLPMRVPFAAQKNAPLSIALELPSGLVVAIDGTIESSAPAPSGKGTAIVLTLDGLTDSLRDRLSSLVAEGSVATPAPTPVTSDDPPAPIPADAPMDELVPPPPPLDGTHVSPAERPVFDALDAELKRLREAAAHEVLGVEWDANVADVRRAYFALTKRHHPDVYARYRADAIRGLAQELFILVNRAYDRMRDAAVAAGEAIVAGPALLEHRGWLVADWGDLGELPTPPAPAPTPPPAPPPAPAPAPAPAPQGSAPPIVPPKPSSEELFDEVSPSGGDSGARAIATDDEEMDSARTLIAEGEWDKARELLARALRANPRNRSLRALYHVASGHRLMADGQDSRAVAQYEAALAHDRLCDEAREALDSIRKGGKKAGLFKRLFR